MPDSLHRSIKSLGKELVEHIDPAQVVETPAYTRLRTSGDIQEACHQLFRFANAIGRSPRVSNREPRFELTKRMLSIAAEPQRLSEGAGFDGTCFQAELRLMRSLARHLSARRHAERSPSAVLFDQGSEPFAYQKADGYPTAYAWREAHYATGRGTRWIPPGALFELVYGTIQRKGVYRDDPRHAFRGSGLIALSSAPQPDDVFLKRMSLEYMPSDIREVALSFAVADVNGLHPYWDQARHFTAQEVGEQVVGLLRGDIQWA